MFCTLCSDRTHVFVSGTSNFKLESIKDHEFSVAHKKDIVATTYIKLLTVLQFWLEYIGNLLAWLGQYVLVIYWPNSASGVWFWLLDSEIYQPTWLVEYFEFGDGWLACLPQDTVCSLGDGV